MKTVQEFADIYKRYQEERAKRKDRVKQFLDNRRRYLDELSKALKQANNSFECEVIEEGSAHVLRVVRFEDNFRFVFREDPKSEQGERQFSIEVTYSSDQGTPSSPVSIPLGHEYLTLEGIEIHLVDQLAKHLMPLRHLWARESEPFPNE